MSALGSVDRQGPVHILLVEDEEAHAEAVRRSFRSARNSFVLSVVPTLREAQVHLGRTRPDIIIADWMLPDGKGTDLLALNVSDQPVPLIVLTSRGSETVAVDALKGGAIDYLVKSPEAFADMPHIVQRALREMDHVAARKKAEKALESRSEQLAKRVKELNCLFEVSRITEDKSLSLEQMIQSIVDLIPKAMRYPDIGCCRLVTEDNVICTSNFRQTIWGLETPVIALGSPIGALQVCYLRERPFASEGPFLKEEKSLLNAIAERLGRVAENKRAEDALRESEGRFRTVIEAAQDCIYIKDRQLKYTHVNPAVERLLGIPASEIVGRGPAEIFGEQEGKRIAEVAQRVLDGEWVEEEQVRTVAGDTLTFHDVTVPLRNLNSDIVGACTISRNITERRKARTPIVVPATDYPSPAMRATLEKARFAASSDVIVLLQGESGSGKDYLARWIHDESRRARGPFLSVNCAAISHELAESELFGHEPGSFTGARGRKRGLLELAEGGTLLLNEIGELSLALQSKLLTFLDARSFFRVGGQKPVHVDARIITASHRNLEEEAAEGRFLRPLLYRLDVFTIHVPPLRDRADDIPLLVEQIMLGLATDMQFQHIPALSPADIRLLLGYDWPGNVRELRNVLERALMVWQGGPLDLNLPARGVPQHPDTPATWLSNGKTLREALDDLALQMCEQALELSGGNKKEAARLLGISRAALYRQLERLGITSTDETT